MSECPILDAIGRGGSFGGCAAAERQRNSLNGNAIMSRPAMYALMALTLVWPGEASAQIFWPCARAEFISGFGIRTVASFLQANDMLSGRTQVPDPLGRRFKAQTVSMAVVYGLHRKVSLIGVFPLLDKEMRIDSPTGAERLGAGLGFGDATFLVKWRLLKRDRGRGGVQLSFQGGVKTPTGRDDAPDSSNGQLLSPPLQRGTGSWDPTADFITSYVTPSARWFFTASVGASLSTEGNDFKPGDRFRYDAMVKTRISSLRSRDLFLLLELNGRWQGRWRAGDEEIDSSGGTLLYLSPGVQYLPRPNLVVEAGVQLPAVRYLNGTQLAPSINLLFGLRYIILP